MDGWRRWHTVKNTNTPKTKSKTCPTKPLLLPHSVGFIRLRWSLASRLHISSTSWHIWPEVGRNSASNLLGTQRYFTRCRCVITFAWVVLLHLSRITMKCALYCPVWHFLMFRLWELTKQHKLICFHVQYTELQFLARHLTVKSTHCSRFATWFIDTNPRPQPIWQLVVKGPRGYLGGVADTMRSFQSSTSHKPPRLHSEGHLNSVTYSFWSLFSLLLI